MKDKFPGCHAREGCPCRGCGGHYKEVGPTHVDRMALLYIQSPEGNLVKKRNGNDFPLCSPIEEQVKAAQANSRR